jgi:hypothetical protein
MSPKNHVCAVKYRLGWRLWASGAGIQIQAAVADPPTQEPFGLSLD